MTSRASELAALVPKLSKARVLCVGDVMLDRFVYGSVGRISPEAPVPVLRVERDTAMLGGSGNVVRNLTSLGACIHFATVVGDDPAGKEIESLLAAEEGVEAALIWVPDRQTSIKTRFIAGVQHVLRIDREIAAPLPEPERKAILAAARAAMDDCAIMVLSDYGKGGLAGGVAETLIDMARQKNLQVIVDPKGDNYQPYTAADIVTPNRRELSEVAHMPVSTAKEAESAARYLIRENRFSAVLATLGAGGMVLAPSDGPAITLAAKAREVFDVSGAGDTVVAVLAAALATGASLADAAELANIAAGIVVSKAGTAAVYAEDLTAQLHHQDIFGSEVKVLSRRQARDRVESWKSQGERVGFTNGCFDLLHPGHISLISQAKAACDRLVVGLNSDASVKRLGKKGPERPIQGEAARATVLASSRGVDMVVIFDEDTPLELIKELRPTVLVKGADYSIETVAGAGEVQSWGGKVILASLLDGFSTTGSITRIREKNS